MGFHIHAYTDTHIILIIIKIIEHLFKHISVTLRQRSYRFTIVDMIINRNIKSYVIEK